MTRSIRLVVIASSPVLSDDDETNMNVEKHERSLLKVVSDVGSTPTASTISRLASKNWRMIRWLSGFARKSNSFGIL